MPRPAAISATNRSLARSKRARSERGISDSDQLINSDFDAVREPLAAIVLQAAALLRSFTHSPQDLDRLRHSLKAIENEAKRAQRLLNRRAMDQRPMGD